MTDWASSAERERRSQSNDSCPPARPVAGAGVQISPQTTRSLRRLVLFGGLLAAVAIVLAAGAGSAGGPATADTVGFDGPQSVEPAVLGTADSPAENAGPGTAAESNRTVARSGDRLSGTQPATAATTAAELVATQTASHDAPALRWSVDANASPVVSPSVGADTIYVRTETGSVTALAAADGRLRWRTNATTPASGGALAIGDGLVVAPTADGLLALERSDGTVRWNVSAGSATGLAASSDVVIATVDGTLTAYDVTDGSVRWEYSETDHVTDPTLADGTAYVAGSDAIHAVDAEAGTEIWNASVEAPAAPVADDGLVVVGDDATGSVVALDATNGSRRWTTPLDVNRPRFDRPVIEGDTVRALVESPPVVAAQRLRISLSELLVLDVTNGTVRTQRARYAPPLGVVGNATFVGSSHGLAAFDSARGTENGSLSLQARRATGGDGSLYVVDDEGQVHAVDPANWVAPRITWSDSWIRPGDSVELDAASSGALGGAITAYRWSFGDGTANATAAPRLNHSYDAPGTYDVDLTVERDDGVTASVHRELEVLEPTRAAFETAVRPPTATVSFDASNATGPIDRYEWTFGDGERVETTDPTVEHTYSSAGPVRVELTVYDAEGESDSIVRNVTVPGRLAAVLKADQSAIEPTESITFDASESTGEIASYRWRFGDGSNATTDVPTVEHSYDEPGSYRVELRAVDANGTVTSPSAQTIEVSPLVAAFEHEPEVAEPDEFVSFDGSESTGAIDGYEWSFEESSGASWQFEYERTTHWDEAGRYEARLKVVDPDGDRDVHTQIVPVQGVSAAFHHYPPAPAPGEAVRFDASESNVVDANGSARAIQAVRWSFGDGTEIETDDPVVEHRFENRGEYDVEVTVVGPDGMEDTTSRTITVEPLQAAFEADAGSSGDTVSFDAASSRGGVERYHWDFGDGEAATTGDPVVEHDYDSVGEYEVELTVVDAVGSRHSATRTVTVDYSRAWQKRTLFGQIQASPTVVDGTVYVGDTEQTLFAFDAETGAKQWEVTKIGGGGLYGALTAADETVYGTTTGSLNNVFALEADTGDVQWETSIDRGFSGSPVLANGTLVAGGHSGFVYGIDAETGDVEWQWVDGSAATMGSPAVRHGTVYVGTQTGKVAAIDAATGETEWKSDVSSRRLHSSPTVVNGTLFVGSNDGSLYAVDHETGDLVWEFDEPDGRVRSSPTVADGVVYVGSEDTALYAVDEETGQQRWRFNGSSRLIYSSPTVVEDTVYVGSMDAAVYAVDADTGDLAFRYGGPRGSVHSSPTVVDGRLFVGTITGNVHAVDVASDGSSRGSRTAFGTMGHHESWDGNVPRLHGRIVDENYEYLEGGSIRLTGQFTDLEIEADEDGTWETPLAPGTYTGRATYLGANTTETVHHGGHGTSLWTKVDPCESNPFYYTPTEPDTTDWIWFYNCDDTSGDDWTFGDEGTGEGDVTVHQFQEPGRHVVSLDSESTTGEESIALDVGHPGVQIADVDPRYDGPFLDGVDVKTHYDVVVDTEDDVEVESVALVTPGRIVQAQPTDHTDHDGDVYRAVVHTEDMGLDPGVNQVTARVRSSEGTIRTDVAVRVREPGENLEPLLDDVWTEPGTGTVGFRSSYMEFDEGITMENEYIPDQIPFRSDDVFRATLDVDAVGHYDVDSGAMSVQSQSVGILAVLGAGLEAHAGLHYVTVEDRFVQDLEFERASLAMTGQRPRETRKVHIGGKQLPVVPDDRNVEAGVEVNPRGEAELTEFVGPGGNWPASLPTDGYLAVWADLGVGVSQSVAPGIEMSASGGGEFHSNHGVRGATEFPLGFPTNGGSTSLEIQGTIDSGLLSESFSTADIWAPSVSYGTTRTEPDWEQLSVDRTQTSGPELVDPRGENVADDEVQRAVRGGNVTRLTNRSLVDTDPDVARVNGDQVVTWTTHRDGAPTERGRDVAVATLANASNGNGTGRTYLTSPDNRSAHYPAIAAGDAEAVVAWIGVDEPTSNVTDFDEMYRAQNVYHASYDGTDWSEPHRITNTTDVVRPPTVAFADGEPVVAWEQSARIGANGSVRYARVDGANATVETLPDATAPALAADGSAATLAYRDDAAGAVVLAGLGADNVTVSGRYPAANATAIAAGAGTVAWSEPTSTRPRLRFADGGTAQTLELDETVRSVNDLSLLETERGTVLAYRSNFAEGGGVLASRIRSNGTWTADRAVAESDGGARVWKPSLAPTQSGFQSVVAAGPSDPDGSVDDVFAVAHEFRPDYVANATGPATASPGDAVEIDYSVANRGEVRGNAKPTVAISTGGDVRRRVEIDAPSPGETVDGTATVGLGDDGVVRVAAGPDVPQLSRSSAVDTVRVAAPSLGVASVDATRRSQSAGEVNVTVHNGGNVGVDELPVELRDGSDVVGNATLTAIPPDGYATVSVQVDPALVNGSERQRVVLDPNAMLPDATVQRRTVPKSLFRPDVTVVSAPRYRTGPNGTVRATVLLSDEGAWNGTATVRVSEADEPNDEADVLGEEPVPLEWTEPGASRTYRVEVPLEDVPRGQEVWVGVETPIADENPATTAIRDEVGAVESQHGTVRATVADAATGAPVPNATLRVGNRTVEVDETAAAELVMPARETTVRASASGYEVANRTIDVHAGRSSAVELELAPANDSSSDDGADGGQDDGAGGPLPVSAPGTDRGDGTASSIDVSSVTVSPTRVAPGEPVTVSFTVDNAGDEARARELTLRTGSTELDATTVSLQPGEQRRVALEGRIDEVGTEQLELDGRSVGTVEVIEPADDEGSAPDPADDEANEPREDDDADGGSGGDGLPGFGALPAVLVAVLIAFVLARRSEQ